MLYTRRRILRDAIRVSMGAAASSSLSSLSAFAADGQQGARPQCGSDTFCTGIRVFFIGAWLFLGESDKSGMLAVTRDMYPKHLRHTFPYGVWSTFNNQSSLGENPAALPGQRPKPHRIEVNGFSPKHQCAQDVFGEAEINSSFNYITAQNADLKLKGWLPRIRVISLPYPTRILPADAMENVTISNNDSKHPWNTPKTPYGFWAAHIFEYEGATSLKFNGKEEIHQGSPGPTADFHFHTLPPHRDQGTPHAPKMFKNLLSVIDGLNPTQFTLNLPPHEKLREAPGPYVPKSLQQDREELCLPKCPGAYCALIANTASCASSGGGVGGH